LTTSGETDEQLSEALEKSIPLVSEFGAVSTHLATWDAQEPAAALVQGFGSVLDGYDTRRGFSGRYNDAQFDFHKFIGHELFVTLLAPFISERRWSTVESLLDTDLYVERTPATGSSGVVSFEQLSKYVNLLEVRNGRLKWKKVSG